MIYKIETSKLKATLSHVPTKDSRECLLGVLVASDGEYLYMVATDGHRAFVGRAEVEWGVDLSAFPQIIIPRNIIEIAVKLKQHTLDLYIDEVNGASYYSLGDIQFTPMDGTLLSNGLRRVIPKEISGATAQFNPKYLLDAQEALRLWHSEKNAIYTIQHNGDNPSVMAGDSAFVVVMPVSSRLCTRGAIFNF